MFKIINKCYLPKQPEKCTQQSTPNDGAQLSPLTFSPLACLFRNNIRTYIAEVATNQAVNNAN